MTQATDVRFAILGPLDARVVDGGIARTLQLGSFKQRVLLAMLLCHSGAVVSVDQLTDALWWERPPRTAHKNIQVYVSHLRRILGGDGEPERIRFRPPGYLIDIDPSALDAARFEDLVRAGRSMLRERNPGDAATKLREALQLWRGAALADLVSVPALRSEAVRFEDRRLTIYEDWIEAELALGHHADVLDRIESLVALHPLRERLRSQQMIALYRYGRQAEALAEYDNLRHALARELGLQPTPALQRLYQSVLSGDAALDGGPREQATVQQPADLVAHLGQLPRDIEDFCGRQQQVADLLGAFATERGAQARRLVTITGPPGAGKTTLAVHVAHQLRRRFPDGQLFVPMRAQGSFRSTDDVLGMLLRQLGFEPAELPSTQEERTALLRHWLAERRVLLILDDAAGETHVRPLLPGVGSSAVIVTGRRHLGGLESAYHLPLGPFTPDEANTLLRSILGSARLNEAPESAERMAHACGLLPLALRIVGAKLAGRPHVSLARYAERLDDYHLLDELVVGDLAMRATAQGFLADLAPDQQAAFRRLGLLPGSEVTADDLAALLDICPVVAEDLLNQLSDANAVVPAIQRDRSSFRCVVPNPLRIYARECGLSEDPEADRAAAIERLNARYAS